FLRRPLVVPRAAPPPAARPPGHRTVAAPGARRLGPLACPRTARAPPDMQPTTALDAIELVLLLLAAAVGIRYLARRVAIAEPILLLVAGVLLGLFPNLPHGELEPDLVFALFLAPIVVAAAYFTPMRHFP